MDKVYAILLFCLVLLTGFTALSKLTSNPPVPEDIQTTPPLIASVSGAIKPPIISPTPRPWSRRNERDSDGEVDGISITLKTFTKNDLLPYDGTDPNLPIYIGLNGKVYDVSAGKDYYQVGGPYHFLAGRDSSAELNLIGGSLITKKYPVIGLLVD